MTEPAYTISSPGAFGTGELKKRQEEGGGGGVGSEGIPKFKIMKKKIFFGGGEGGKGGGGGGGGGGGVVARWTDFFKVGGHNNALMCKLCP